MSNPRELLHKVIDKARKVYNNKYVYNKIQLKFYEGVLKRLSKEKSTLKICQDTRYHYEREIEVSKYVLNKSFKYFNKTKQVMLEKGFDVSDIYFDLTDRTIFE